MFYKHFLIKKYVQKIVLEYSFAEAFFKSCSLGKESLPIKATDGSGSPSKVAAVVAPAAGGTGAGCGSSGADGRQALELTPGSHCYGARWAAQLGVRERVERGSEAA